MTFSVVLFILSFFADTQALGGNELILITLDNAIRNPALYAEYPSMVFASFGTSLLGGGGIPEKSTVVGGILKPFSVNIGARDFILESDIIQTEVSEIFYEKPGPFKLNTSISGFFKVSESSFGISVGYGRTRFTTELETIRRTLEGEVGAITAGIMLKLLGLRAEISSSAEIGGYKFEIFNEVDGSHIIQKIDEWIGVSSHLRIIKSMEKWRIIGYYVNSVGNFSIGRLMGNRVGFGINYELKPGLIITGIEGEMLSEPVESWRMVAVMGLDIKISKKFSLLLAARESLKMIKRKTWSETFTPSFLFGFSISSWHNLRFDFSVSAETFPNAVLGTVRYAF